MKINLYSWLPYSVRWFLQDRWLIRWLRLKWCNWFMLRPKLVGQLGGTIPSNEESPDSARILIPLIQTSHYQVYQILAFAKALQLRGASIKVIVCGSLLDGCEVKNSRLKISDPCMTCRVNSADLLKLYGLDIVRLSDFLSDEQLKFFRKKANLLASDYPKYYEYKGIDLIKMVDASVTRYYYGAVSLKSNDELKITRQRYLYSAIIGIEVAARVTEKWMPTAAVSDMAVYCDWAPYERYFKKKNIPYHLLAMSPFDVKSVMLNYGELYDGTMRFERWQQTREEYFLNKVEQAQLWQCVEQRFSGDAAIEKHHGFYKNTSVEQVLFIDKTKRNIFLFPNLFWDVGLTNLTHENRLFDEVLSWVLKTAEILTNNQDCHLYIKPHPAEVYGSAVSGYGVTDALNNKYPELPSNITIISPELQLKSYDLFPFIDLGVVYTGTVGLEMLLKKIPIVTLGAAPYAGHELSSEPKNIAEYEAILLGNIQPVRPVFSFVELFAYFYFVKAQLPWRLTKQVYADNFDGYQFNSLNDLLSGNDPYLDHLCECILRPEQTVIEAWETCELDG